MLALSHRFFSSQLDAPKLAYEIPVPALNGPLQVRLHFMEPFWSALPLPTDAAPCWRGTDGDRQRARGSASSASTWRIRPCWSTSTCSHRRAARTEACSPPHCSRTGNAALCAAFHSDVWVVVTDGALSIALQTIADNPLVRAGERLSPSSHPARQINAIEILLNGAAPAPLNATTTPAATPSPTATVAPVVTTRPPTVAPTAVPTRAPTAAPLRINMGPALVSPTDGVGETLAGWRRCPCYAGCERRLPRVPALLCAKPCLLTTNACT
jgi:hypothetical protein